jgi:hypothetical protein
MIASVSRMIQETGLSPLKLLCPEWIKTMSAGYLL